MALRTDRAADSLKVCDKLQAAGGDTIAVPVDLLRDIRSTLLLGQHRATEAGDRATADLCHRERERLLVFVPYISD